MCGSPDGYGSISSTYAFGRSSGSFDTSQVCSSAQTFCHLGSMVFGSYRSTVRKGTRPTGPDPGALAVAAVGDLALLLAPRQRMRAGEVRVAGPHEHGPMPPEVPHGDRPARHARERAVTAVHREPSGAAHGRLAVPAVGPEAAAAVVAPQPAHPALAGR